MSNLCKHKSQLLSEFLPIHLGTNRSEMMAMDPRNFASHLLAANCQQCVLVHCSQVGRIYNHLVDVALGMSGRDWLD